MGNGSYLKGNESYIREMDGTSSKWIVHYGNGRTSGIVPLGNWVPQWIGSAVRFASSLTFRHVCFFPFRVVRVIFKSEVLAE